MGRGIVETGLGRTERLELEQRTSDPASTQQGEMWLRTDLSPAPDQIATLRVDNGSGTWDVPVFDDAASTTNVEKVLRVPVGGTVGFVPVTTASAAFPDLRFQHNGSQHQVHDALTASAIPDSGLWRYEFEDDTDTSTAIDSWESQSVSAYDGAINGGSYSTDSNKGSLSLLFDGNDDTIDVNSRSAFPIDFASDGLTIVAYIKFNSIPSGPMAICEQDGQSTGWAFWTENGSDLKIFHRSSDSIETASLSGLSTGTWHFCVGQYDAANNDYRLRIDGSSTTKSDGSSLDNPNGDNRIGRDANNNWQYLDAYLSEYRIYNKFLSSSELDNIQ